MRTYVVTVEAEKPSYPIVQHVEATTFHTAVNRALKRLEAGKLKGKHNDESQDRRQASAAIEGGVVIHDIELVFEQAPESEKSEFPGRAWAKGTVLINGLAMHVYALRVVERGEPGYLDELSTDPDEGQRAWQDDFDAEYERWAAIAGDGAGDFQTVGLPGLEGRWIILAHPHC